MKKLPVAVVIVLSIAFGAVNASAGPKWYPNPHDRSVRQTSEVIDFSSGAPGRGGGVLTRNRDRVSARVSTMDLDANAAYSVWWVVFNNPAACLVAWSCGEDDIFSAPGVLNATQIAKVRISVFYADGFVTGDDGIANVYAHLESGSLPAGTFVNFGWSTPVMGGPDPRSGLQRHNGMRAEMHMVVRTHGPAAAGSVGVQTSTFTGLCDSQICEDQQAIIFPSALAP
jgi:hypothetical protein